MITINESLEGSPCWLVFGQIGPENVNPLFTFCQNDFAKILGKHWPCTGDFGQYKAKFEFLITHGKHWNGLLMHFAKLFSCWYTVQLAVLFNSVWILNGALWLPRALTGENFNGRIWPSNTIRTFGNAFKGLRWTCCRVCISISAWNRLRALKMFTKERERERERER